MTYAEALETESTVLPSNPAKAKTLVAATTSKPRTTVAKKVRPARSPWEEATVKVRREMADAIELLSCASTLAQRCETRAEKAVSDLGSMLGERMLPEVVALLEPGPIYQDVAGSAGRLLGDPVQILEALAGIALGSPFEQQVCAAERLVRDAWDLLEDMESWQERPAVAKPSSKAATKVVAKSLILESSPNVLGKRFASINSDLKLGRQKLSAALDSLDVDAPVELVLSLLVEGLIPNALSRLYAPSFTLDDVDWARNEMLTPLAILGGAVSMCQDGGVKHLLEEAFNLLDKAHSDLDLTVVAGDLPARPSSGQATAASAACLASPNSPNSAFVDACSHLNEAVAVLEAYAHQGGSDACFGVCSLLALAAEEVEKVLSATNKVDADRANETTVQALAMLGMYCKADAEAKGDLVVRGVITLAELGKSEFDDAFEKLA
ncbi:hypothetical protein J7E49_06725 [Variovorax paradoxus]|nr:hypothetical protein [Variovorax paradoxus]